MRVVSGQPFLDSARKLLAGGNLSDAAAVLGKAPVLLREHADLATTAAKNELRAAATALDSLVQQLNAGKALSIAEVMPTFIGVNMAEAEHHRSRAAVAWANHDSTATGEELIMSADHFERALIDLNGMTSSSRRLVDRALALGAAMAKQQRFNATDVNTVLASLGREIRKQSTRGVPQIRVQK